MPSERTHVSVAPVESSLARERLIGDILFGVQMSGAIGFGVAQALLMLTTTEGVSISWLSFWGIFLLINLSLSYRAHQLQPSRVTLQTVITYATWTTLMLLDTGIYLWRDSAIWTPIDTWTTLLAGTGIAVTLFIGHHHKLTIADPLVQGYLAVFFKGVPQLTLAYNILMVGGAGVSIVGILFGHITICSRLGQILMSLREASWDRNRQGSAISEIANEASWIVATIAWFIVL